MAQDKVLHAERIIVGREYETHIELSSHGIRLNQRKLLRIWLHLYSDLPSLILYDANGQERIALSIDRDGTPQLALKDGKGETRLEGWINERGTPLLELRDALHLRRLSLELDEDDNTPSLCLFDKNGEQQVDLSADEKGTIDFRIRSEQGLWEPWNPAQGKET